MTGAEYVQVMVTIEALLLALVVIELIRIKRR